MRIRNPYTYPHNWLKGNFHTHTTLSDGQWTAREAIAAYRDDGYDFLALTDHDKLVKAPVKSSGRMLILPGQECHISKEALETGALSYHVVGLGLKKEVPRRATGQALLDGVKKAGGLAYVAHPRWTQMPYDDFDALEGYDGFEVWNGNCQKECGRGYSCDYWDRYMTASGRALWAIGVDDTHLPSRDFGTGWTHVNAARTPAAIYRALRNGDAYASSGPRFETIRVARGVIKVNTSAARAIKFVSTEGRVIHSVEGEHVKSAAYKPNGGELYVRVEAHAHDGTVAWSNPFMIEP